MPGELLPYMTMLLAPPLLVMDTDVIIGLPPAPLPYEAAYDWPSMPSLPLPP